MPAIGAQHDGPVDVSFQRAVGEDAPAAAIAAARRVLAGPVSTI